MHGVQRETSAEVDSVGVPLVSESRAGASQRTTPSGTRSNENYLLTPGREVRFRETWQSIPIHVWKFSQGCAKKHTQAVVVLGSVFHSMTYMPQGIDAEPSQGQK